MALDLRDCSFIGPALPEPFVKFQLEKLLRKEGLLPKDTGADGKALQARWDSYRRKLRLLGDQGGAQRVAGHVLEPLAERFGYTRVERQSEVVTREGSESGGLLLLTEEGAKLRAWACEVGQDLDAPSRRGRAFRFSPSQVALRVLQSQGERVGLLTDGLELRLLICDASRKESHIAVRLDRSSGWRSLRVVPDSYRLLHALVTPAGVAKMAAVVDEARLAQTTVTAKLRVQAQRAILDFVNELLDRPENQARIATRSAEQSAPDALAAALWHEGLILIYRLLFIFQLEASPDPARAFTFASASLWRTTYSPSQALAPIARKVLDSAAETGRYLEDGLRALFRMFETGLQSSEMKVSRLAGMLFEKDSTPLLDRLTWGERAVALLLSHLLWTESDSKRDDSVGRERVHYGSLDVENLGRVYEALLELEPGLATEPMCRLRRDKLEVVLPAAQGEPYRQKDAVSSEHDAECPEAADAEENEEDAQADVDDAKGKKAKVAWVESIAPGRFYLRVGLGRKASGSYYTPHPFVRFLVEETLEPQLAVRSPKDDPQPGAILKLRVLDPAMGSGHFLVEVCRFLGDRLYEACRLCDELAQKSEDAAARTGDPAERERHKARAAALRQRVIDLPDPDDEMLAYLPSRAVEGEASGLSQSKARAIARRLVAVHCLYGVDKNPLAVELAKLSLWLESYAEGLPLTCMDHRLVCGDSLTGPFVSHLSTYPRKGTPIKELFSKDLQSRLELTFAEALTHVSDLEASVGVNDTDTEHKRSAKRRLDEALSPLKTLAATWTGLVQRGAQKTDGDDDDAYAALAEVVASEGDVFAVLNTHSSLAAAFSAGRSAVPYDLTFPEVFFPEGKLAERGGFDAVVGNPPWDAVQPLAKEFYASFDLRILDAPTRRERAEVEKRLNEDERVQALYKAYIEEFDSTKRIVERCYSKVNRQAGGRPSGAVTDLWQVFAERGHRVLRQGGHVGWVLPSAFHANQSATGIRDLYLSDGALKLCYSFENSRKLFNIHLSFKFAAVVAVRSVRPTSTFPCAFYLRDLNWLVEPNERLLFSLDFVQKTGGEYLSFLELSSAQDAQIADCCFRYSEPFGSLLNRLNVRLGVEIDMSKGSHYFALTESIVPNCDPRDPITTFQLRSTGYLSLHEGKTFHQYQDHWEDPPRYLVPMDKIASRINWLDSAQFFRLAFRAIASSTNERTGILAIIPPGFLFGNSSPCERNPRERENLSTLILLSIANSFAFDWNLRNRAGANVNLFILNGCPAPKLTTQVEAFLSHAALRLTCNHAGYAPLWHDQLAKIWREPTEPQTWPVLANDGPRWAVRAAIDAVVADAYGLSAEQYRHILSSFSHKSYPQASALCMAAFQELKHIGLDAFVRKHDPYWDIPLVRALPTPVLTFPQLAQATATAPTEEVTPKRAKRTSPKEPKGDTLPLFNRRPTGPKD